MKTAYVVVHGFGGNSRDVESIKINLNKFGIKKEDIFLPLIIGHRMDKRGFYIGIKYSQMVNCLITYILNVSKSYEKIIVIGYSMGALISMCASIKSKVDKLIVINPPIYIWDFSSFRFWIKDDIKRRRLFHAKNLIKSLRYRVIRNTFELRRLRKYTIKNISHIHNDTFVIQSKYDYVAKPTGGKFVYDKISSKNKEIKYYSKTSHFIPSEELVDNITKDIYEWINMNIENT